MDQFNVFLIIASRHWGFIKTYQHIPGLCRLTSVNDTSDRLWLSFRLLHHCE
jgi:hypothetical protein